MTRAAAVVVVVVGSLTDCCWRMVRSEEAQDSGAGVGSGVPPLLCPLDGWWKLNQLDNWLRLDPGRDSDFLLDDVVVVVVAAAAVVVD